MTCRELQSDIQAYMDGELSPVRRAAIESHLSQCADCRRVLVDLQTVSKALHGWSEHRITDKFEVSLYSKLAVEAGQSKPAQAPKPAAVRPDSAPPAYPFLNVRALRWLTRGWRPVATAAAVLVAVVVFLSRDDARPIRRVLPGQKPTVLTVLASGATNTQVADAWLYAGLAAKRAVATPSLQVAQVVSSDVVATFLASVQSDSDQRVGVKLMNILAGGGHWTAPSRYAGASRWRLPLPWRTVLAATRAADPLEAARKLELEGRYTECFAVYKMAVSKGYADRASLAEGALRLRLGELDAAQVALGAASGSPAKLVALTASELLGEIARARAAGVRAASMRQSALSAAEWAAVALAEVEAYDYRSAANSFMKAASLSGPSGAAALDARFRSAWCQREIGQISTSVYGFRAIAEDTSASAAIAYAAGVEQALGLGRMGRYAECVDVAKSTASRKAPDPALEAFLYFYRGFVELRQIGDAKAAAESLNVVASAGQGNLSYAAAMLAQALPK